MGNLQQNLRHLYENSQEEEVQEVVVSSFTCEICIEPVSPNKKFKNKNNCCSHPYCLDCIAKYIEVKVEENTSEVKCPDSNCKFLLDAVSCRSILPTRVFDKWCDVLCDSAVLQCERAYCPFPNCSVLIINECGGNVRKSKCPNCKNLFCFRCKLPWDDGHRCNGETRDRNDILFNQLAEVKKWTRCPTCHHYVELVRGCTVVKCRCQTVFCYACGRKLSSRLMICGCKNNRAIYILTIFMLSFCTLLVMVMMILRMAGVYLIK